MRILPLCTALLASTIGSSSQAQPTTEQMFVARALSGPAGQIIDNEVDLHVARVRGAGLWPNPSLNWNRQALPGSGLAQSTQDFVWLSVPLVLSGRTFAESSAAADGLQAARLLRTSRRAQLRRNAMVLFYRALCAQQQATLLKAASQRFSDVAEILSKRAAAGESSGYDALRLQVEQAAFEDRVAESELHLVELKSDMRKLTGVEIEALSGSFVAGPTEFASTRPPLAQRLKGLELQVKAAQDRASAARRRAVPDPVFDIGLHRQGGGGQEAVIGYYIGVEVPLTLFDRGQGEIAQAEAQADRLEIERANLLAEAAASLAASKTRLAVNRARFSKQTAAAEKAASLLEIARKGYALGGVAVLSLIDAERSALDVGIRALERGRDVRAAEADVSFLTGLFDEKGGPP